MVGVWDFGAAKLHRGLNRARQRTQSQEVIPRLSYWGRTSAKTHRDSQSHGDCLIGVIVKLAIGAPT